MNRIELFNILANMVVVKSVFILFVIIINIDICIIIVSGGRHGDSVVSAVASQQEGPGFQAEAFLCLRGFPPFLLPSKDIHLGLVQSFCVSPAINCQLVYYRIIIVVVVIITGITKVCDWSHCY